MVRFLTLDLLMPAALGALATLGFAPFNYYPLTVLALAGLVALWWASPSVGRCAWRGFAFGVVHFATGVYWVYVSTHVYGGAPVWAGVVAAALLAGYMALYPMLVGFFAGFTRRLPRVLWALLLVPGAWVLSELLRSWAIGGFPWGSLGYAMSQAPVTALAPIGGVYFISFWVMLAAGTLCLLIAGSLFARLIAVCLIGAAPLGIWALPAAASWTQADGKPLSVAVIQGNIDQSRKWQPEQFQATLDRYRQMTERSHTDLVVWPEVAIPALSRQVQPYLASLDSMARQRDQTILAGVLQGNKDGRGVYNAVDVLGVGQGHYYKRHLVPFGEYFPVPNLIKRAFVALGIPVSQIAFGPTRQPLIRSHGVAIGLSICFEDVFGYEIARSLPAAGALVNVTNDAWFAGTTAAAQHLQIAQMRALESGRPMIRAANTGISAIIGYTGRIRAATGQGETARLVGQVTPRRGLTPYMRHGDQPLWLASMGVTLLGLLGALLLRLWRRRY
jgi:apolipoprotein N-acyltransferase